MGQREEAREMELMITSEKQLQKQYPKVQPLVQALLEAAGEQGATVEDFMLACDFAKDMVNRACGKSAVSDLREQLKSVKTVISGETITREEFQMPFMRVSREKGK